ncbi:MAG: hypothetical protein RIQ33_842, partial [Bacteroidota bacterium]
KDSFYFKVPRPPALTPYVTCTASCKTFCNGSASVSVGGGISPYQLLWSTGSTANNISNVCYDSTYTCTVTDACGTVAVDFDKTPFFATIALSLGNSPSCKGVCNGIAFAYIQSGGFAPYQYNWSNGVINNPQNINVCYDSVYTCIVTDGCGSKDTNSIKIPLAPLLYGNINTTSSICNPNCNASATLTFGGGYGPYYFYWNNNSFAQTANNLCTDSFYYCILSTAGCGIDTFYVHIPTYIKMQTSCSFIKRACDSICNGSALVHITLGLAPYTVLWSSGETTTLANQLCVGQNYCIVTDSCGKKDTAFINIPAYPNPIANTIYNNSSCNSICNGSATATSIGGIAPYTYLWSSGTTSATATNLCLGTNTCIVTDACISRDTVTVNILLLPPPNISITANSASCNTTCNGVATALGSNSMGPYSYLWSSGATVATATNLCIGISTCVVTDVCSKKDTASIIIVAYPTFNGTVTIQSVSCTNQCTGKATASGTGGKTPYTYLWSNGITTAINNTLCKGNNWCIITDNCNLHDTINFIINIYPTLTAVLDSFSNSCLNTCNGYGRISVAGGNLPYSYLWTNLATTSATTSLCIGNNTCIVTDACGIKDTVIVYIDTVPLMKYVGDTYLNSPTCLPCKGSLGVTIKDGWSPITYVWNTGATTSQISNLCPGFYSVVITNPYCNSDTFKFSHTIASNLKLFTTGIKDASCYDTCNGQGTVVALGGIQPYNYLWSNGYSTATVNKFCNGTFTVKVTDSTQGYCMDTITIHQPPQFNLDTFIQQPHCFNLDGSIKATISGGTAPYQFLWSTGSTSDSIYNLPNGNYWVTITDSHQCTITQPIYMIGLYPTVQVSPRDTLAGLGQSVTLTATGAVNYHWLNSSYLSCDTCKTTIWNSIYNGDTYCVEGLDIYGCSDTACLNIRVYDDCGFIGLPKAFTPNGDGTNDIYIPLGPCIEKINFFIFDRWGNLLFESHDKTFGWDGKFKGEDMPMEVYVWKLKAYTSTGRSFDLKGNVTLIR